jgi:hypothetical protein
MPVIASAVLRLHHRRHAAARQGAIAAQRVLLVDQDHAHVLTRVPRLEGRRKAREAASDDDDDRLPPRG